MHTARALKSLQLPPRFALRVEKGGGNVHVVTTYDDQQRPCWFLLKADALNIARLKRTDSAALLDLTQYGEILDSGWGHRPVLPF